MPLRSKKQRAWLWAHDPMLARRFEDHTPKGTKLPERVESEKKEAFLPMLWNAGRTALGLVGLNKAYGWWGGDYNNQLEQQRRAGLDKFWQGLKPDDQEAFYQKASPAVKTFIENGGRLPQELLGLADQHREATPVADLAATLSPSKEHLQDVAANANPVIKPFVEGAAQTSANTAKADMSLAAGSAGSGLFNKIRGIKPTRVGPGILGSLWRGLGIGIGTTAGEAVNQAIPGANAPGANTDDALELQNRELMQQGIRPSIKRHLRNVTADAGGGAVGGIAFGAPPMVGALAGTVMGAMKEPMRMNDNIGQNRAMEGLARQNVMNRQNERTLRTAWTEIGPHTWDNPTWGLGQIKKKVLANNPGFNPANSLGSQPPRELATPQQIAAAQPQAIDQSNNWGAIKNTLVPAAAIAGIGLAGYGISRLFSKPKKKLPMDPSEPLTPKIARWLPKMAVSPGPQAPFIQPIAPAPHLPFANTEYATKVAPRHPSLTLPHESEMGAAPVPDASASLRNVPQAGARPPMMPKVQMPGVGGSVYPDTTMPDLTTNRKLPVASILTGPPNLPPLIQPPPSPIAGSQGGSAAGASPPSKIPGPIKPIQPVKPIAPIKPPIAPAIPTAKNLPPTPAAVPEPQMPGAKGPVGNLAPNNVVAPEPQMPGAKGPIGDITSTPAAIPEPQMPGATGPIGNLAPNNVVAPEPQMPGATGPIGNMVSAPSSMAIPGPSPHSAHDDMPSMLQQFSKAHGTTFDPHSRVDQWKMKQLQSGNAGVGTQSWRAAGRPRVAPYKIARWLPKIALSPADIRQKLVGEGRITQGGAAIPQMKPQAAQDPHGVPYLNNLSDVFRERGDIKNAPTVAQKFLAAPQAKSPGAMMGAAGVASAGYNAGAASLVGAEGEAERRTQAQQAPAQYSPKPNGGMTMTSPYGTGSAKPPGAGPMATVPPLKGANPIKPITPPKPITSAIKPIKPLVPATPAAPATPGQDGPISAVFRGRGAAPAPTPSLPKPNVPGLSDQQNPETINGMTGASQPSAPIQTPTAPIPTATVLPKPNVPGLSDQQNPETINGMTGAPQPMAPIQAGQAGSPARIGQPSQHNYGQAPNTMATNSLSEFQRLHGKFNPNSAMDRWKMQQLQEGNRGVGNRDWRQAGRPGGIKVARWSF